MCGIYGGISSVLSSFETEFVQGLANLAIFRGTDSSGITVVTDSDKNKNKLHYFTNRSLLVAPELFQRTLVGNRVAGTGNTNGARLIMGHARAATLGLINTENSHPFTFSNIIGCHNGTVPSMVPNDLTEDEKKTPKANDSWNIFKSINDLGLDATLARLKYGAYTLVWLDKTNQTLNFIRNDKRPLFFASNGGTMYWSSEKEFLEFMKARARQASLTIKEAQPYIHYTIPIVTMGISLREEDKTAIAKPEPVRHFLPQSETQHHHFRGPSYYEDVVWELAEDDEDAKKEILEGSADTVDESKTNSCVVIYPNKKKCSSSNSFQHILDLPKLEDNLDVDYFKFIDVEGTVVAEPSLKEYEDILRDNNGCACCGAVPMANDLTNMAYFSGKDPKNFKQYYYICKDCLKADNHWASGCEDTAYELYPVYVKEK